MSRLLGVVFAALWLIMLCSAAATCASDTFGALLQEADLRFARPDDCVDVPIRSNPVLSYERALRSSDGKLEIRYLVRPLRRLQIGYDDPHGSAPDPNLIFPLVPLGHKFAHVFYAAIGSRNGSRARARSIRSISESRSVRVKLHSNGLAMDS